MQRLSYPHIATETHPHATGKRVALSLRNGHCQPEKKDVEIAGEILSIHSRLRAFSDTTGEWKWVNISRRNGYLKVLNGGNAYELADYLANMFRNDATYGIIGSDSMKVKTKSGQLELENQILLDLDTFDEFNKNNRTDIEWSLRNRRCGNPYGYMTHKNKLIVVDTARHLHYANKITALLKDASITCPTIFEIGGGYGGLCLELFRKAPFGKFQFIDCDLPETLYLCYFFLKKMLPPSVRIEWAIEKMPDSDIVLVPAHKKDLVKSADVIFNMNSLSEMGRKTVSQYMNVLHNIKPLYFLHQNSNYLLFPKSKRHIEILASEFPIKRTLFREVYAAIAPWQGGGGRYREYLYVRKEK